MRFDDLVVLSGGSPAPAAVCDWCQLEPATHAVGQPGEAAAWRLCAGCVPRPRRIVGYSLEALPCVHCLEPAFHLLADVDACGYQPVCPSCLPAGAVDEIAKVLARAIPAR